MSNALKEAVLSYKKEIDQNVGDSFVDNATNSVDNIDAAIDSDSEELIIEDVTFKVQIAASSRDLEPKSYNFKGLSELSKEKVGQLYKYFYGSTSDYHKAKQLQEEARLKGYNSSFVVAYKDGKQIDISEALKTATN